MAQLTTTEAITETWVQKVDVNITFMMTAYSGDILYRYTPTIPAADDCGHIVFEGESFGNASPSEKLWVRARKGNATLVITRE